MYGWQRGRQGHADARAALPRHAGARDALPRRACARGGPAPRRQERVRLQTIRQPRLGLHAMAKAPYMSGRCGRQHC